ncbi:hypothetical protein C0J52_21033 [Blattella germanica]|nr:hypothetical protein C0J52_21033 [Blattella germanica]
MAGATFVLALVTLIFFVTKDATRPKNGDESTTDSGISESTSSWDHEREREQEDGIIGSECREDSPLLASGSTEYDLYTREKVEYYESLVHEDDSDHDRMLDVRRTVGITAGGACEV